MNLKTGTPNFPKNNHFLPLDTHTCVCVSGGKKCSFFGQINGLCFLVKPVLRFALLPCYQPTRCNSNYSIKYLMLSWKSWYSLNREKQESGDVSCEDLCKMLCSKLLFLTTWPISTSSRKIISKNITYKWGLTKMLSVYLLYSTIFLNRYKLEVSF